MRPSLPPPGTVAFIYGSCHPGPRYDSNIANQVQQGRARAQSHGWQVAGEFSDEVRGGRGRPNFNNMIDMAIAGRAEIIVVENMNCLLQAAAGTPLCAQRLEKTELVVVTAADGAAIDGRELSFRVAKAEECGRHVKRGLPRRRQSLGNR